MATGTIPALVKHVTMAIFDGKSIPGSGAPKFLRAFTIARAVLTKNGHLVVGSEAGDPAKIGLTATGAKMNRKHLREGTGKGHAFDTWYALIESSLVEVTPGQPLPAPEEARATPVARKARNKKYVT